MANKNTITNALLIVKGKTKGLTPCRACLNLNKSEEVKNLFENFASIFTMFTSLDKEDGFPQYICDKCSAELSRAVDFMKRVEDSQNLLNEAKKSLEKGRGVRGKKKLIPQLPTVDLASKAASATEDNGADGDTVTETAEENPNDDINLFGDVKISKKRTRKKSHQQLECIECVYKTARPDYMAAHIRSHTGEKPYVCTVCGNGFSQKGTLWTHQKTHSATTYFTCGDCGKQFKHKSACSRHIHRIHSSNSREICRVCRKALKSTESLRLHMKRHMNIKCYSCETCGFQFVSKSELKRHLSTHLNARTRHECHLCQCSCSSKTNLSAHIRTHSGDKPFMCSLCPVSFWSNSQLKVHSRRHTRECPYSCPTCEVKFRYSSSLNRHMLRMHRIEYRHSDRSDRRVVK